MHRFIYCQNLVLLNSQQNNCNLVLSQLASGNNVILHMSTRQERFVTDPWAVLYPRIAAAPIYCEKYTRFVCYYNDDI